MILSTILPKSIYFFAYVVFGSCYPFLNAFMLSVGFSATQAGFISGIRNVFCVFGVLWNALADYTKYRRLIMAVELFGMVMFYAPLPLVPKYLCHLNSNITDNTSIYKLPDNTECVNKIHLTIMLMIFAASIFDFALIAFIDGAVVQCVKENQRVGSFGEQRVFASIGFALSSLLIPVLIDTVKLKEYSEYALPFSNILLMSIFLFPVFFIQIGRLKYENVDKPSKYSLKRILYIIISDFRISMFFIVVLVNGIGVSLIGNFLYIFLTDKLKAGNILAGVGLALPTIFEMIVFATSKYLIKLFGGPKHCIIIGCLSFIIRLLVMSFSYNIALTISIQALHAFGFALYWAAGVEIIKDFSPENGVTSMMTMVAILQGGSSNLIANMLGGYLYDLVGGRNLFLYLAFLFAALLVYLIGQYLFDFLHSIRYNNKSSSKMDEEVEPLIQPC